MKKSITQEFEIELGDKVFNIKCRVTKDKRGRGRFYVENRGKFRQISWYDSFYSEFAFILANRFDGNIILPN